MDYKCATFIRSECKYVGTLPAIGRQTDPCGYVPQLFGGEGRDGREGGHASKSKT
jgi:hypothetical protein